MGKKYDINTVLLELNGIEINRNISIDIPEKYMYWHCDDNTMLAMDSNLFLLKMSIDDFEAILRSKYSEGCCGSCDNCNCEH